MNSLHRCEWVGNDPLYVKYHDEEWGVPVHEDGKMFEFLVLETFQAGLSWLTILRKRENFRLAFDQFDFEKIARYDEAKVNELMSNAGIIRNGQKIRAAINNARCYQIIREEFGSFCHYIWGFVDHKTKQNSPKNISEVPAKTELSDKISKDLKKRGFKFVGSTTIYAHMQACGMVNDHTQNCFRHGDLKV